MIPVSAPYLSPEDERSVMEALNSGWISSEGPYIRAFEEALADNFDRRYVSVVSSGTAALEIAFAALELKPGDEVILPDFMIVSCLFPILRVGATPVFVDCDIDSFNCDPEKIIEAISDDTKAILLAHIYGLPVDLKKVISIAEKKRITIIEDAAEVIGQTYDGSKCGSIGDISIFSFYPNKHITTGEGGALLTNCKQLKEKFDYYRNLGFTSERFIHTDLAWNYRMTSIQAALGLSQLSAIERTVEKKRTIGRIYNDLLKDLEHVKLPIDDKPYAKNIYWVYPIVLTGNFTGRSKHVQNQLRHRGIGTRPFFYPLSRQPLMNGKISRYIGENNALKIYESGFYIPSGVPLTINEQELVATELRAILK